MAQLTLTDDTPRRVYAVGVSPQSAFTVPFAFFATSDLDVYVGGTIKALGTDYTVATVAADDGFSSGTVNLLTPVTSTTVVVELALPIERTANFPTGVNTLNIFTLNTTLTRLFAILQQLRGSLARALTLQANDATPALLMPLAADRANKVLGFDADGDPIATDGSTIGGAVVSGFMATVLDDANAAAARATLGAGTGDGTADYPTKGTDIASASTLTLPADESDQFFDVTGTTTITAIGSRTAGRVIVLKFEGILTLTHNATDLVLPSAANITTAVGDVAVFVSEGSGDWRCVGYQRATGQALVATPSVFSQTYTSADQTVTLGGALTLAHGLAGAPVAVFAYLVNVTGELGYSTGQRAQSMGASSNSTTAQLTIVPDATNINIRFPSGAFVVANYTTGASSSITPANWRLRVTAFA